MDIHFGQDWKLFCQAELSDVYESIGDYNLFMVCNEKNINAYRDLPTGYSFRRCRHDELDVWKRIVVEEQYVKYVTEYYEKIYSKNEDEFFRRCFFVCDNNDNPVASCITWLSYGQISTVGWFRVLPEHERKGIGRALLTKILNTTQCPIYLQPTSICAIKLYSDFGFKIITNPMIGYRKNNLFESLPYLNKIMSKSDYENLKFTEIDDTLDRAALSSETAEF